jgi:predicted metal-dependent phosphoesterase TrpH
MRIDLHAHSAASDGTDQPAEVVRLAAAAGVDVLALTDHDTTAGWPAAVAARPASLSLVRGAEFSTHVVTDDRRRSVHLLGYLFDPDDPVIVAEQARLVDERLRRGLRIVQRMVDADVPISADQVLDIAAGAPVGRPHIGRALVDLGLVSDVTEAFASYLSPVGPYYVPKADTDLPTAIEMICAAGGASVVAHPWGRSKQPALDAARFAELAERGLTGIEVHHPDHSSAVREELSSIAAGLGLVVTGSSDYHGSNKALQLGQETTSVEMFHRLVDATSGAVPVLGAADSASLADGPA